jgi:hypothetical protein
MSRVLVIYNGTRLINGSLQSVKSLINKSQKLLWRTQKFNPMIEFAVNYTFNSCGEF